MDTFDCLSLAAVVAGRYFCVHGGISPHFTGMRQLNEIDRFKEVDLEGLVCDFLWSDPASDEKAQTVVYKKNKGRNCAVKFGLEAVQEALNISQTQFLVRAHEVQQDGYRYHSWEQQGVPNVVTIFSAPNYC